MGLTARFLSMRAASASTLPRLMGAAFLAATVLAGSGCALVARMPVDGSPRPAPAAPNAPTAAGSPAAPSSAAGGADRPATGGLPNVAQVAADVRPAVTFISTRTRTADFFNRPQTQEGAGSGFILDNRGYIATNNHVVSGASDIQVVLPDGRTFDSVKVVGTDPRTDLAVLKIEGSNLPLARLGDSDTLRPGDWVVAIGNALGLPGGPTVTAGVISAVGRSIQEPNGAYLEDLIQTDAAINPGNSGGPLIDMAGRVVGINTAIASNGQGIGFAINMNAARAILDELIEKGRVVRGVMGVNIDTMSAAQAVQRRIKNVAGAVVDVVGNNTAARRAGIQVNDVITGVDGQAVKSARDLLRLLAPRKPGETVSVTFSRNGEERTVTVTLAESS